MHQCKSITCDSVINDDQDFCIVCRGSHTSISYTPAVSMAVKYPEYFVDVEDNSEIDIYKVHQLFNIQDPSGCIQSASKRLLMSSTHAGDSISNITKARDTLNRWLELNPV
jgi:hypothetical protein